MVRRWCGGCVVAGECNPTLEQGAAECDSVQSGADKHFQSWSWWNYAGEDRCCVSVDSADAVVGWCPCVEPSEARVVRLATSCQCRCNVVGPGLEIYDRDTGKPIPQFVNMLSRTYAQVRGDSDWWVNALPVFS